MHATTRRTFLTAGATALAGTATATLIAKPKRQDDDVILAHLGREVKRLHRRARQRKATQGDSAVVAAHLRLLADHPSLPALQAAINRITLDDVAQADLEAPRRAASALLGEEVAALELPTLEQQQTALLAFQADLPDALRGLAQALEDGPGHRVQPAQWTGQETLDREWTCGFLRAIQFSLMFGAVVLSIASAGGAVVGIVTGTALFFQVVSYYGC